MGHLIISEFYLHYLVWGQNTVYVFIKQVVILSLFGTVNQLGQAVVHCHTRYKKPIWRDSVQLHFVLTPWCLLSTILTLGGKVISIFLKITIETLANLIQKWRLPSCWCWHSCPCSTHSPSAPAGGFSHENDCTQPNHLTPPHHTQELYTRSKEIQVCVN